MQKKFFPNTKIQTVLMILIGFIIGSPMAISFLIYEEDVNKAIWGFPMTMALLVSYIAVILIAWLINRKRKFKADLHFELEKLNLFTLILVVLFSFQLGLNLPFQRVCDTLFSSETHIFSIELLFILVMVLIMPVLEEILFRGFILKGLLSNYSPKKAIIFSGTIFGIINLQPSMIPGAICFGLLFGYIYYKTNSIGITILLHAATNLFGILASYLNHYFGKPNLHTITDLYGDYSILLVVILIVTFIASFWYLFKKESKFNLD